MVFMDERCGAWQFGGGETQGALEFRIFFPAGADPHVSAIRVSGDFQHHLGGQDWDFAAGLPLTVQSGNDPRGVYWSVRTQRELPAGFYQYKFEVEFEDGATRKVTDPCARYSGLADRNSGVVVGGSAPADNVVEPLAGGRRPLTDLVIYELMIDDFSAGYRRSRAPLAAVGDRLDELRDLGVTAIEFLPWTAWEDQEFDWGYEPFQYFAVEARYANDLNRPAEKLSWLKRLVGACHARGIHVIMDGVFNHVGFAFSYPQLYEDPADCPFTAAPFGGTFTGLQDLNFAEPITGQLIGEVCNYWIDVFGIDGIRFDSTVNYHVAGDMRGLPQILAGVDAHVSAKGEQNFALILEHLDITAAAVTNATPATSFWDDSLYQRTFDGLWNGRIDSSFLNALNNRQYLFAGKVPTLYLSNHDHSHVAWQSGARDGRGALGGWWRLQPYLIALFTSTAVPLIRNGDEFGEETVIPENDENTGRRVTPRPLRWKIRDDRIGAALTALHGRLAQLRSELPALRSAAMYPHLWEVWQTQFNPVGVGVDVERQLVIYHRWAPVPDGVEIIVVVLNFSDIDQLVEVPFPVQGRWTDRLAGFAGGPDWYVDVAGPTAPVQAGSHFGRILHRFDPNP
jgi:pullulanase